MADLIALQARDCGMDTQQPADKYGTTSSAGSSSTRTTSRARARPSTSYLGGWS